MSQDDIPTGVPVRAPLQRKQPFFKAVSPAPSQPAPSAPVTSADAAAELDRLRSEIQSQLQTPAPGAPEVKVKEVEVEPEAGETDGDHASTGASAPRAHCQHCGWDLSKTDVLPTLDDKRVFQVAMEGMIPFVKAYNVFQTLSVVFRELHVFEVDACFEQLKRDNATKPVEPAENWQALMRYRLVLQLRQIRTGDRIVDLPDGLNRVVTPGAKLTWDEYFESSLSVPAELKNAEIPLIKRVTTYVIGAHLGNESRFRAISDTCAKFQRLTSKLEAMKDSPDFW